jgi:hypothetical protein
LQQSPSFSQSPLAALQAHFPAVQVPLQHWYSLVQEPPKVTQHAPVDEGQVLPAQHLAPLPEDEQ